MVPSFPTVSVANAGRTRAGRAWIAVACRESPGWRRCRRVVSDGLLRLAACLWLVCLALLMGSRGFGFEAAGINRVEEYQIKSALLAKLPLFVQWPASQGEGKLVVGVLGDSPVYPQLAAAHGQVVGGRKLEIRKCLSLEDVGVCQIVFVSGSDEARLPGLLARAATTPLLTVGEQSSFIEHGGVVALVAENRKVHLEINLAAARKAGLRIDPQLLQMARVVRGAPGRGTPP